MSGLCRLQRLCQSKGRAVQAHIKIHTTAYEKVSRLCFLCCRHCVIGLWVGFVLFWVFYSSCILNLPAFSFLGSSPDFGFPTDSCDLLSRRALKSMSQDKVGALYIVTCSTWTLGQFDLHLQVLVSEFKCRLLFCVWRALVSNVLILFY